MATKDPTSEVITLPNGKRARIYLGLFDWTVECGGEVWTRSSLKAARDLVNGGLWLRAKRENAAAALAYFQRTLDNGKENI